MYNGGFTEFLRALGEQESNGNYGEVNTLGFTGKYQFGEALLKDLGYYEPGPSGFYNGGGNRICRCNWRGSWNGKHDVYSYEDFRNNVGNVQDIAIKEALQYNTRIIMQCLQNKGRSLGECLDKSQYTYSGILAAAHLQGAWGAADLITEGRDRHDEYGTSMTSYARKFSNFDVASALGFYELRGK